MFYYIFLFHWTLLLYGLTQCSVVHLSKSLSYYKEQSDLLWLWKYLDITIHKNMENIIPVKD